MIGTHKNAGLLFFWGKRHKEKLKECIHLSIDRVRVLLSTYSTILSIMYFRFSFLFLTSAAASFSQAAFFAPAPAAPHRSTLFQKYYQSSTFRVGNLRPQEKQQPFQVNHENSQLFLSQNPNSAKSSSNDASVQEGVKEQESSNPTTTSMAVGDLDVSNLSNLTTQMTESMSKVMDNMSSGELGTRGELFVVGQLVLMLSILYGDIPLFGDTFKFLLGPGMFVLGGVVAGLGVKELGSNISPFPKVGDNTDLVTDGIFGEIRHPIYAGLLYACLGISIWSGSATRLLLTAALWYLLTKKSDFEEQTLVEKFPDYEDYLLEVEGKFIPERLLKSMPWVDKD
jgi:Putative protein-S-isoprenylcysteine methyltransferase